MTRSLIETLLSIGVLVVAVVFLIHGVTVSGQTPIAGTYTIKAKFENIDGIEVGDQVRVAGIEVGKVSGVTLDVDNFLVEVTMTIRGGIEMFTDSFAAIQTTGLFGGKYIQIDPGGGEDTLLRDGDFIAYVQDSVILDELVQKIVSFAQSNRRKEQEKLRMLEEAVETGEVPSAPGSEPSDDGGGSFFK